MDGARAANVPLVIDEISVYLARSNDTYVRVEMTNVGERSIQGLVLRAQLLGPSGVPVANRMTGASSFDLWLETPVVVRSAGLWGPFFVEPPAVCLKIRSIELTFHDGRLVTLTDRNGLGVATALTVGSLCP